MCKCLFATLQIATLETNSNICKDNDSDWILGRSIAYGNQSDWVYGDRPNRDVGRWKHRSLRGGVLDRNDIAG